MFSPRVLALLAIGAAAVAALPADPPFPRAVATLPADDIEDSWFGFPFFSNIFAPIFKLFPSFDFGPKIISDNDKFQVAVPVKDYTKDELKVKVRGQFVSIQGTHESKPEEHSAFASQFYNGYTLPQNASASDVKAELSSDGWLTVTAPFSGAGGDRGTERVVDIVETHEPRKESDTTTYEDDRKEPTTPATEREEVTDRDNSIPHGTEAALQ